MTPDHITPAELAANPALAAEVNLDQVPELLGEMGRLRAILRPRSTAAASVQTTRVVIVYSLLSSAC